MLVRIFRSTSLLPPVLLFLLAGLAMAATLPVFSPAVSENGLYLYDSIVRALGFLPFWCTALCSSLLIFSQALHLNLVLNKHSVQFKSSWLPALIYLFLASLLVPVHGFSPVTIVNTLLIFVLDKLFGLYKNPAAWGMIFDASLLLSVAALVYLPVSVLFVYLFIALALLRPLSWREWIIGLMGLAAPFFFLFVYLFLNDSLEVFLNTVLIPGIRIEPHSGQIFRSGQLISLIVVAVFFLMSVFNAQSNYYRNVAKTRVAQQLLLILVPFTLLTLWVAPDAAAYRVGLMVIPLAVFLSYFFLAGKKSWLMEVYFLVLLGVWVWNRLMPS